MAEIVLLHSAFGLDSDVRAWAENLRAEGHHVTTPDMYRGDVFNTLDEAVATADTRSLVDYAADVREDLGAPAAGRVYAGFSLGAGVAQILALTDPDARGLVLMHAAVAPHWIEIDAWPAELRAQLHYSAGDPWVETPDVEALAAFAGPAALETFVYPGAAHLFGFERLADYDAVSAHLMWGRVCDFVRGF